LEAAIAARDAALDRTVLASRDHLVHVAAPTPIVESGETVMPAAPTVVTLRVPLAPMARETTVNAPGHLIPDVSRLSLRLAVRTLEDSGFHVALIAGQPGRTWPAAGTVATPGTTVRLAGTP
jgi:hypothetical protein